MTRAFICASITALFVSAVVSASFYSEARASEAACFDCHGSLSEGENVHAPVSSGFCFMCHTGVDPSEVPHRISPGPRMGLSYEGADLCYACHEKSGFTGGTVHQPVSGGMCVYCHRPHRSDIAGLMERKALCFDCHGACAPSGWKEGDEPMSFERCLPCHEPHAGKNGNLLR